MKIPPEQVQEIDLPDLSEIFADSLILSSFDGQVARMNFAVTRVQPPKPPKPPTFKRYPVVRLVLTPEAVVDLYNQAHQLISALQKFGVIKVEQGKPPEVINKTIQ